MGDYDIDPDVGWDKYTALSESVREAMEARGQER
jgi:hypothetical protein